MAVARKSVENVIDFMVKLRRRGDASRWWGRWGGV